MPRISQAARAMLDQVILPFWKGLRDEKSGGYCGYVGFDLKPDPKREKGGILNSRILWFFSQAAMTLEDPSLLPYARHAYRFLVDHCLDQTYGGVYWSLTCDGNVLDDTKHTYNQAFAIYALAAYHRLTGEEEPLRLARQLFHLIEENCTDQNGYLEAFTRNFQPASNEKLSENGVMAARTMNTLLHVFEGYAGLYQAAHDPEVAQKMLRILSIYTQRVYDPLKHRQTVFFDPDYRSLIDLTSYGHDIESSWLIDWGASLLEDENVKHTIYQIDSNLAENILNTAFSGGSVANECDKGVVDVHRVWWVQAEAVLGFVNAWQKHPQQTQYRDAAAQVWHYISEHLVDPRPGGEWFWRLNEDGSPDPEKPIVEPWKCPYHNGRMCLELIRRDPDVYV